MVHDGIGQDVQVLLGPSQRSVDPWRELDYFTKSNDEIYLTIFWDVGLHREVIHAATQRKPFFDQVQALLDIALLGIDVEDVDLLGDIRVDASPVDDFYFK